MMDFRSGSPSDNSGAEEMEVSLAKPKHRVVRPMPHLCRDLAVTGSRRAGPRRALVLWDATPHSSLPGPLPVDSTV